MRSPLFDSLKAIKEAEAKAQEIVKSARAEAESILERAQADSIKAYDTMLDYLINEGERRAEEMRQEARKTAQNEADTILEGAKEGVRAIRARAEGNFERVVQLALEEVLSFIEVES